jgi:hypothetical protein
VLALMPAAACGGGGAGATGAAAPVAADRARFLGTWAGGYACPGGVPAPDTLAVRSGTGTLDVRIVIHVGSFGPDSVVGTLTAPERVDVPTPPMGGLPRPAALRLRGTGLGYRQRGLGLTCGGADYRRVS